MRAKGGGLARSACTMTHSSDYHDYVFKDGELVGEFEQMYRHVDDPWHCRDQVDSLDNALLLALVRHSVSQPARVLDLGCGLGALTARILNELPGGEIHACDVSPTAIAKAGARYPGIRFFVHDLRGDGKLPFPSGSLDVVTMAQLVWYILPELNAVLRDVYALLRARGRLAVLQYFPHPDEQKYGRELLGSPAELVARVSAAGFEIQREVYINRTRPQNLLLGATKVGDETERTRTCLPERDSTA